MPEPSASFTFIPERVTITPQGQPRCGDVGFDVHPGRVVVRSRYAADAGRVRRIVDRRRDQCATAVHPEVVDGREESEAAVL